MHALVKFTTREFAEAFQSGFLYMNSLGYFSKKGFVGQKDIMEGVVFSTSSSNLSMFPKDFIKFQATDVFFQSVGFSFCHVFCMSCIDLVPVMDTPLGTMVDIRTPLNMEEFGKYAVIIDDEAEFLRRISKSFKSQKYLCRRVDYHPPTFNGQEIQINRPNIVVKSDQTFDISDVVKRYRQYDAFDKFEKFRNQNEWRLCLYDGNANVEAIEPNIGDIHDISHVIKASNLEKELDNFKYNKKMLNSSEQNYGNSSRRELRELFNQLGNNKAWLLFTIG